MLVNLKTIIKFEGNVTFRGSKKKLVEGNKQWASIKRLKHCESVTLFDVPSVHTPSSHPSSSTHNVSLAAHSSVVVPVQHLTSAIRHKASVIQPSFSSANLLAPLRWQRSVYEGKYPRTRSSGTFRITREPTPTSARA